MQVLLSQTYLDMFPTTMVFLTLKRAARPSPSQDSAGLALFGRSCKQRTNVAALTKSQKVSHRQCKAKEQELLIELTKHKHQQDVGKISIGLTSDRDPAWCGIFPISSSVTDGAVCLVPSLPLPSDSAGPQTALQNAGRCSVPPRAPAGRRGAARARGRRRTARPLDARLRRAPSPGAAAPQGGYSAAPHRCAFLPAEKYDPSSYLQKKSSRVATLRQSTDSLV